MHKQEELRREQRQRNWVWSDCKLVLRRFNPNNASEESYENLQAEVELESEEIKEPFIPEFRFQNQLLFNPRKGFCWKKCKPLPPLMIKLQKSYFNLLHEDQQIIMIYCELAVAYPKRKDTHFYLQQILTVGEKRKPFSECGEVVFDGILMKQSSEKKLNSKFSYVVSICASSIDENKIILKTLISTAFYSENTKLIRHQKWTRQVRKMKLFSPNQFLKPLGLPKIRANNQECKESLLQFFKYMNRNSSRLSQFHPFYVIYHFYHLIKVYYHSEEVNNLEEILQKICPDAESQKEGLESEMNPVLKYELKKTKKIKKYNADFNNSRKIKTKKIIEAQFTQSKIPPNNLLLITFEQNILQFITNEIQKQINENSSSNFQLQLERQIQKLDKIFEKWRFFYTKIDLLKRQSPQNSWKDIEKQSLFETYKSHYHKLYVKLTLQTNLSKANKSTTAVS